MSTTTTTRSAFSASMRAAVHIEHFDGLLAIAVSS